MPQERFEGNPIREYVFAIAIVHVISVVWILFNEVVMSVESIASDLVNGYGIAVELLGWLVTIYRIIPIIMIVGVWVWAFLRAFKREPYTEFGGYA